VRTLVIVRHGESVWNKENLFTGWHDVDLTEHGKAEARHAGGLLNDVKLGFDVVFTSVLKRAIKTAWLVLDEMDLVWLPIHMSWRLNERHYGALEGLSKTEQALKYGEQQVQRWRRSYDIRPPQVDDADPRHPRRNPRYSEVNPKDLPSGESLKDVVARFIPYWDKMIAPQLKKSKRVLIVAHGNSLRALVKHIEGISDEKIVEMELPTGMPRIYELDRDLKPVTFGFAANPDEIRQRIQEQIQQGKAVPPRGKS